MDYIYSLEERSNQNLTLNDIVNENGHCILHILCYHIETSCKYPFLQFMMEKIPFCNNLVKEQLILPYIFISDLSNKIEDLVLNHIKNSLNILNCNYNNVNKNMYKGIIFNNDSYNPYALVNITGIDIYGINLQRQSSIWFALPSEIINTKSICNIPIDEEVTQLFQDFPEIGLLYNHNSNKNYILPDAVYTGSEMKKAEFCSIFGNWKSKVYECCKEYYYFYRSFSLAVKDGGWLKEGESDSIGDRKLTEYNKLKYLNGAINRYALFVEGKIHIESGNEFSLTDDMIETLYPEPCIIISYSGDYNINPDMLVKNYENFVCLSYHKLNDKLLNEKFIESEKNHYMIA